jgi:gliding motility-associated-like protein
MVYKLPYSLCDTFTPKNCTVDTVTITVTPLIDPKPDTFALTSKGGTTPSIVINDTTNGFQTTVGTISNSTISQVNPWPTGISLDTLTGKIIVQPGTPPDEYKIQYTLCDKLTPKNCVDETVIIVVSPDIDPDPDTATFGFRGGITPSIVLNDTTNGLQSTLGILGNSTVAINGTWPKEFTLNPNTGEVTVASWTAPKVYKLTYILCDTLTPKSCKIDTVTITILPSDIVLNPDINVTYVNVEVSGNVSTNDVVEAGTTYGKLVAIAGNPSAALPILSPSGSYNFIAAVPGVYKFEVEACPTGITIGCPTASLTITVLEKDLPNNPVANVDIATTIEAKPVTLFTLANDKPGSLTTVLVPNSVTITSLPKHGMASVNPINGNITYTPMLGFIGKDTLTYNVCDNVGKCASANQIITVVPDGKNTTTATDDYITVKSLTPVTGNVLLNDLDPEGNKQTVTPQTTTVPGKGTLILLSDGSFTFTLTPYYKGPINFPYTLCDNGTPVACASATLYITSIVERNEVNPDINVTYVNVEVFGNVSTNDFITPGTTYGNLVPFTGNPSAALPKLNPDGSYSFIAAVPGVYQFEVEACPIGITIGCPSATLTITVLEKDLPNNPVANVDIATTIEAKPVTLLTLANDKPGSLTTVLVPSSVTIVTPPKHGVATVNPLNGNITYTPNTGFTGKDTLTYNVCDDAGKCASANQIITVIPSGKNTTTATDDYITVKSLTPVTGNVLLNDLDPEGNKQTVTPQTVTVPGKGTLILLSDGSFTFTLAPYYKGPINFPYTVCDDGIPVACASATLYITSIAEKNEVNPDINVTYVNVEVFGNISTNDFIAPGTTYGNIVPFAGNPSSALPKLNPDGSYSFIAAVPGVYQFEIEACPPGTTIGCPTATLTITVLDKTVNTNKPVANVDIVTVMVNTPAIIPTLANDRSGNKTTILVTSTVTIISPPKNGKATVNPITGDITYTPNPGFTGKDTIQYSVCDNAGNCATAFQIITVLPISGVNRTTATDDYATVRSLRPLTGNVLINDVDPEGHTQKVVPQTITIPGKGTLVLLSDGSYTFTLEPYYNGPVNFVYTLCDNGTPIACASATLYITSIVNKIDIPNYISPNGDGLNDFWEIDELMEEFPNARAIIYNRWGSIVWRTPDPYGTTESGKNLWRGDELDTGKPVPDGVYFYLLELEDGFRSTKSGFIEVMRQ